ncbi:MAG: YitT family protein [Muribaculaceae bacterium]|nr:YitT family protein [Muribaculaceae bacterium]
MHLSEMFKKEFLLKLIKNLIFMTFGAIIAGFALEAFLVPHEVIDGGIIGISMILSHVSKFNLGLLIILLNLPFILLAFKKMGALFVILTAYANIILALSLNFFHSYKVTDDILLSTVFGGIVLGTGVGLILKNEASLDGTEILSLLVSKKFGFSVGEFIMGINLFIYLVAGKVFGWESAMYSILTYFIASRVIDVVMEGLNSSKSVRIISDNTRAIGQALIEKLDISVTYLKGVGGYSGLEKDIIYCVISRLELPKMIEITKEIDPNAFVSVVDVHETYGGRFRKKVDKI